jgi:hypothetical protein
MDFVSDVDIGRCFEVTTERSLLEADGHEKTDVLQIKSMLWYAYVYLKQHGHFDVPPAMAKVGSTVAPAAMKGQPTAAPAAGMGNAGNARRKRSLENASTEGGSGEAGPTDTGHVETALDKSTLADTRPSKRRRGKRKSAKDRAAAKPHETSA